MTPQTDRDLLRLFAEHRSDAAFAGLVERHVNLVYSVAHRQTGDAHHAEEITQAVFIILAEKAGTLRHEQALSSWLFQTTRLTANNFLRSESRRRAREQEAFMQCTLNEPAENAWPCIAPLLDRAVETLCEADRRAILLRFYEGRNLREVGTALGATEDAAKKRVNRAVEKLRKFFTKHGLTLSVTTFTAAISANSVQAAPVGLAANISAVALAGTAVGTSTLITTATKTIAMTTFQKIAVTATLTVTIGAGIYEAKKARDAQSETTKLQVQQAPMQEQIKRLQSSFADATNRLADLLAENARLKSNQHQAELLKLRGQVTQLKVAETENLNDPTIAAAKSWAERVELLKRRFAEWAGKQTPEIELLTEQDWLDVAAKHQLGTEEDCREAMSDIRTASIERFAGLLKTAVGQYIQTNNRQPPSSLSQLTTSLNLPTNLASTILNGYEIALPGTVHPPKPGPSESEVATWAVLQKNGPADPEYDNTFVLYSGGWYYYGPNKVK